METCKTCKYWTKLKLIGKCDCKKFVYFNFFAHDYDWEDNDQEMDERIPERKGYPLDGLIYGDSEAYAAFFCTGPDFGCIYHCKKPQKANKGIPGSLNGYSVSIVNRIGELIPLDLPDQQLKTKRAEDVESITVEGMLYDKKEHIEFIINNLELPG